MRCTNKSCLFARILLASTAAIFALVGFANAESFKFSATNNSPSKQSIDVRDGNGKFLLSRTVTCGPWKQFASAETIRHPRKIETRNGKEIGRMTLLTRRDPTAPGGEVSTITLDFKNSGHEIIKLKTLKADINSLCRDGVIIPQDSESTLNAYMDIGAYVKADFKEPGPGQLLPSQMRSKGAASR